MIVYVWCSVMLAYGPAEIKGELVTKDYQVCQHGKCESMWRVKFSKHDYRNFNGNNCFYSNPKDAQNGNKNN